MAGARKRMGADLKPINTAEAVKEAAPEAQIYQLKDGEKFQDLFAFDEKIYDAGDRSQVFHATDKKSNQEVVVKMRMKGFFSGGERVWRGVLTRFLNLEKSDHVLGMYGIWEDEKAYYVVMERCHGGELFDFLLNETDVPERECKRIMREILKSVDHLHSQGMIHRDIKPENILFKEKPDEPNSPKTLKLIDFDTCQENVPDSPKATKIVGTPGYIAPESFTGEYTPASDLWSVGVILYILLTGDMPYPDEIFGDDLGKNNTVGSKYMQDVYQKLKEYKVDFDCPPWPDFPQARDLCQSLLAFDPSDRSPSARDALKHPWLSGK